MGNLVKAAKEYRRLGISAIATDDNKRAVTQWKQYEQAIATDEQFTEMFGRVNASGIATLCGPVSGNMEAIDVDCKYDLTGSLFADFIQEITDADAELVKKLVIVKTVGGGYHLIYRCSEIEGNKKLASRHTTPEEKAVNPHEKVKVLIETRGRSGYIIATPTEGYSFSQNHIRDIAEITPAQRRIIFEIARSFNQVVEEYHNHEYTESKPFQKSPFADYNERGDVVNLLVDHGWKIVKERGAKTVMLRPGETTSKSSGDFNRDLNLFSVFTTSSEFEPNKGYKPSAVYAMLKCSNDWKIAAKMLLDEGYGEPYVKVSRDVRKSIIKLQNEGLEGENLIKELSVKKSLSLSNAKEAIENVNRKQEEDDDAFWYWDSEKEKLTILYTRFARFLEKNGFGLYFYDKQSSIFRLVLNDNNRLEEASTERIKKFIETHIKNIGIDGVEYTEEMLLELIYKNKNLFAETLFEYLHHVNIDFLKDTKDTAYLPFKNGIIEIKADGVRLRKYGEINKVIWRNDIIDFHIDIDPNEETTCEFADFVQKITGGDNDRLLQAISLFGYELHKFKDPARPYALILGEETDDEGKGGGTGKGIFSKAIEHISQVETIDGKTFSPGKKNFAYQRVKLNTRNIIIQDVPQYFDFSVMYNLITEGITIEKKNQDELYIPFADSPKIIITTNYAINDSSNHAKRRLRTIEFSNHFSPAHTPLDEYGHLLFDDWDKDEWNRFYNFCFIAIKFYLEKGIHELPQSAKFKTKKLKTAFGEDFTDWFIEYLNNGGNKLQKFSDLHNEFLTIYDVDKKDFSMKKFKKGLKVGADNFGFNVAEQKMREDGNRLYVQLVPFGKQLSKMQVVDNQLR